MGRSGITRLLDLRPGELRPFALAFMLLAFTIAGHTLVETARDALFLARLPPERLTAVYVGVALGSLVVAPFSGWLVRAIGARNSLVGTLVATAYGISWFRLKAPTPEIVFALYVFGALAATTLVAQFWLLASSLFTAAQGRRLFGPLAAGGVLGGVAGAGTASLLLLNLSVRSLLMSAAAAFFGAALVATGLPGEEEASVAEPDRAKPTTGFLRALREEPFLWRLAAIAVTSTVVSVLIDYVFKVRVAATFDKTELGPFFAKYQLILNSASLVLQLLITAPLVARLGVVGLSLLAPAMLLIASGVAGLGGASLFGVVLLKGIDGALKNSVGRVSLELLWSPVPALNKAKTKAFIDGVVTRGAQAGAAIALFMLTFQGADDPLTIIIIAAAFAATWLAFGSRVRAPYVELFRKALRRGGLDRDLSLPEIDMTGAETLVESLARPEPSDVIAAMNVLSERGRGRLISALVLYHDSEAVLLRALELFSNSERKDWIPLGERLLNHPLERVELAAVRALAVADARDALGRAAKHENAGVRATAAFHLAQVSGGSVQSDARIAELVATEGEQGHQLRLSLIDAIAAHPTANSSATLLKLAEDRRLQSAVTVALSRAGDVDAIEFLIERLAARDDRRAARAALVRLGEPALIALVERLNDEATPRSMRLHIPRTLAAFENTEAIRELVQLLRSSDDGRIRYKALRGLEQIAVRTTLPIPFEPIATELARNCTEYLRLFSLSVPLRKDPKMSGRTSGSLVLGLVLDKLRQSFDRITRLVQTAQRMDDISGVFAALESSDRHQRARAIEFLDALVRNFQRNSAQAGVLRLVVDELSDEERARRAAPLVGTVTTVEEALLRLTEDSDPIMRELAQQTLSAAPTRQARSYPPPDAGATEPSIA